MPAILETAPAPVRGQIIQPQRQPTTYSPGFTKLNSHKPNKMSLFFPGEPKIHKSLITQECHPEKTPTGAVTEDSFFFSPGSVFVCICISQIGNDEAQWSTAGLEIAGSHTNRKRCVVLWQARWRGNRESRHEKQRMEKDECKEIDTVRQTHLACRENQIVQFLNLLEKSGQIKWMKIPLPNGYHWAALEQGT